MNDGLFDAIIIGGGLSGLAAAYTLAEAEKNILLIEKGDYCGAKNVTGGRMYVAPVRSYFDDFWDRAPLERSITREELCVMSEQGSLTVSYTDQSQKAQPSQSYSVCRAKFDKYFAKQAEKKGAIIVTKQRVDKLAFEDGQVVGVYASGDYLPAKSVICCDGVLSLFPQQAALRGPLDPNHYAVGLKEIIELDPQIIEQRFNLAEDQGAARLFMGDATKGKFGGGFLYTNRESVSLGLVLGVDALTAHDDQTTAPEMLERFKARPEVAQLIAGGQAAEYSAHIVPEGSLDRLSKLYGDGILVAGDSAGFSLNAGITVRGMEYSIASGRLAAQAVIRACESDDFRSEGLSVYERLLNESFVMKDFKEHLQVASSLDHDRFFGYYPGLVTDLMHDLYAVEGPKKRIYPTLKRHLTLSVLKDILFKDFKKIVKL